MKYQITGVKRTPIAKKDGSGTWTKLQVKTAQTGDTVLDLGFSIDKNTRDNLKVGDTITGYVESKPWSSNGKSGVNMILNGITAEYVYELLVKAIPGVESLNTNVGSVAVPTPTVSEWDTGSIPYPTDDIDDEAGF